MKTATKTELLDVHEQSEYHIWGRWSVSGVEIDAAVGVPESRRGTADAAGTFRGLCGAWFESGWDRGDLSEQDASRLLGILDVQALSLLEQYGDDYDDLDDEDDEPACAACTETGRPLGTTTGGELMCSRCMREITDDPDWRDEPSDW